MESAEVIALVVLVGLMVAGFIAMLNHQQKLDDPDNTEVVYLDQLIEICAIRGLGNFRLRILRQSGNPQKDDQYFDNADKAIKAAVTTFKRAKIDYVVITANEAPHFNFRRPYHHHGGKAEGKKVGSVEITRMS
ncbi:MAG: hypothetical protein NXH96_13295 [Alteromonadaceae bacterium]|nr:hypothetical protein [Alteromonadaceae bacterium]